MADKTKQIVANAALRDATSGSVASGRLVGVQKRLFDADFSSRNTVITFCCNRTQVPRPVSRCSAAESTVNLSQSGLVFQIAFHGSCHSPVKRVDPPVARSIVVHLLHFALPLILHRIGISRSVCCFHSDEQPSVSSTDSVHMCVCQPVRRQ